MHLVRISITGITGRGSVDLELGTPGALHKWTVLPGGPAGTKALVAIAASLAPGQIAHLVERSLGVLCARKRETLRTELTFVRDGRDDGAHGVQSGGWQLSDGCRKPFESPQWWSRESRSERCGRSACRAPPLGNLVLAYGRSPKPSATDSFDFSDTEYPFRRIGSLLDPRERLTHPVRFLERVNAKAHRCGTSRQKQVLARLCRALTTTLELSDGSPPARGSPPELSLPHWAARAFPYRRAWHHLRAWERRVLAVIIDAARHANDAFPRCACPFDQSGVLVLDRPDLYGPLGHLGRLFAALDELFPRLQFILTLGNTARDRFPRHLFEMRLGPPPNQPIRSPPYKSVRIRPPAGPIPRGSTLLVQVDGTLPNFALMQLSQHLKSRGDRVGLCLGLHRVDKPARVYASCVFTSAPSLRCLDGLRRRYGNRLVIGGSGVDLERRLGPHIESLPPDYSLYPSLGDRSIGFLTRGCPGRCAFCVVPRKEGGVRQVADLDMLLQNGRKKLILLDDNLLAYPKATELLEEMVRRQLSVNFNQTLDLRRLDADQAELLRRLHCSSLAFHRRVYHFSLNSCRGLDVLRRCYNLLQVTPEDNAEFVCMYGYNTSLAEDLERLRFLRSLPRAYVFMQRYRPVPGGPAPDLSRLFDERSDEHLSELVRIVFPQNMKNVERYYRWLCFEYARQRGRIHHGLVATLFRYNYRHRRGAFLEQLEEIARSARVSDRSDSGCSEARRVPDEA
ncbi:MAG: hypothetical protein AB1486_04135 [Planctomycetota bacterium]